MTRFAPGDVALIRHLDTVRPDLRGREVTVLTGLTKQHDGSWYAIDIPLVGRFKARPHALKPLPPPDTRSTWSEGVWQPKGLRNVIDFDALLRTTE